MAERLVQIPLVLLAVSILVFWLVQVVPGNPGRNALGPYATAEQVARWNAERGLDGPIVLRYLGWLGGFVTGDWGTSIVYSEPVAGLVLGRLGNSMLLGLLAFALLVPVAIGLGAWQAAREGRAVDRSLTVLLLSFAAVPEFVVGVLLLILFALVIPALPIQSVQGVADGGLEQLRAMILPAATLALGYLAIVARMTRSGVIETLASQHYRAAVIKGVTGAPLFLGHVARNALIPTVSLLGVYLGTLLGGSAVVETLFNYPGLGALLVTATQKKDIFILEAGVMVTGAVSLLALLATDIAFTLLDPRVRFTSERSA